MKDRKSEIVFVVGICITLLIFFTFYDLNIAQWVYRPDSTFGWFFQAFGEVPAFLFASLSSAYMITQKDPIMKQKRRRTVLSYGFVLLFSTFLGIKTIFDYLGIHSYLLLAICIIIWLLLSFEIVKIVPYDAHPQARKFAKIVVRTYVIMLVILCSSKVIWGRMRFLFMEDALTQFTPWYVLQPFASSNVHMSFPSGHSAQGAMMLCAILLPYVFERCRRWNWVCYLIGYGWPICVMVSRMVMGRHFGSDVIVGFLLTYTILHLMIWKVMRERE